MSRASARCLIAVGSNLGDRLTNVGAGVAGLASADGVELLAVSKLYETAPVGGPDDQGAFFNAAVLVDSTLPATELLALLHHVEADRERRRIVRWGPRTLDLDVEAHPLGFKPFEVVDPDRRRDNQPGDDDAVGSTLAGHAESLVGSGA